MVTQRKTTTTRYRRKRDYSQHVEWSYELNCDVCKCYNKARENSKIGYIKRVKEEWDKLHPELAHFTQKQLRQQATFVASKSIILETNLADTTEGTSTPPTEQLSLLQNQRAKDNNPTFARDERQNNDNNNGSHFEFNVDQSLLNDLQDRFHKFYNEYIKKLLEERNYDIKMLQKITKDQWQILNYIIESFVKSNCILMDLWTINVTQYCAILAILEKNNSSKEKNLQPKKQMKHRWLIIHEQKINNIRPNIYQSYSLAITITPLTKHQETIKVKLKKWYKNIKYVILNAKLAELKHKLKVTSNFVKNKKLFGQISGINHLLTMKAPNG